VEWEEGTHSIVSERDVDGVASALKKGDITRVKVHKKLFEATVVGSGEKREMIMLQDSVEDSELEEAAEEEVGKDESVGVADNSEDKSNSAAALVPVSPATRSAPVPPAADSIPACSTAGQTTPRKRPRGSGYLCPAKQRKSMPNQNLTV
jgi:hypothetical protein